MKKGELSEELLDELEEDGIIDLPKEPKHGVKWDTPPRMYKCSGCNIVTLIEKETEPNRICETCKSKVPISEQEKEWMATLTAEANECKRVYDERRANPVEGYDYLKDEDRNKRFEIIDQLKEFGHKKGIWVWTGISMY